MPIPTAKKIRTDYIVILDDSDPDGLTERIAKDLWDGVPLTLDFGNIRDGVIGANWFFDAFGDVFLRYDVDYVMSRIKIKNPPFDMAETFIFCVEYWDREHANARYLRNERKLSELRIKQCVAQLGAALQIPNPAYTQQIMWMMFRAQNRLWV